MKRWVVVAGIPTPQGNGDSAKEVFGGGGVVIRACSDTDSLADAGDGGDGVLCKPPPRVSAIRGTKFIPDERQSERLEASLH